jgi:aryl-alcohol dehydrogenase-like predicted oxidoreductase
MQDESTSRRDFIKKSSVATAGLLAVPHISFAGSKKIARMTRPFGKLNFDVTTFGLGGQASLQWTPQDVDPVPIIIKAYEAGVNYFDTSNLYGPSQLNYGKAFRQLGLVPGLSNYDDSKRKAIFLTSKSQLRYAKGKNEKLNLNYWSNGDPNAGTLGDVRRSLSQIFGDGNGSYPAGAYLDMVLLHTVTTMDDVEAAYEGYDNPDPNAERIGALAALLDVRDGTNKTGLNPKNEKLIRHIGFSGHYSPVVMTEIIHRDSKDIIDGMLVAINANDKLNFNMQHNVIPIAAAKNMGIIAMKVFADGAMYTKPATWSNLPEHVVRCVGTEELPSAPFIHYTLTTPGVSTLIIGIGQVSDDHSKCQLYQNITASQIEPGDTTPEKRKAVELLAQKAKEGKTNYFQDPTPQMIFIRDSALNVAKSGNKRNVTVQWHTAFAKDEPIDRYEILRNNTLIATIPHRPQTTLKPFEFKDEIAAQGTFKYKVVAFDKINKSVETREMSA